MQAAFITAEADVETLRLHLVLGDVRFTLRTAVPAIAADVSAVDAPWSEPRLVTFSVAGSAGFSQRRSGSWAANLRLKSISAVDDATVGSAYRRLVTPRLFSAPGIGPAGRDGATPHFFRLEFEQIPIDRRSVVTRVRLDSQPIDVVVVPVLVRGLASFALSPATAMLSSGVTAELASLSTRAPADVYAILAQRQCLELHANLAAPTFVIPDDPCDASSGEVRIHLGELVVDSEPASAAPITLCAAQWPPQFDPSLLDEMDGGGSQGIDDLPLSPALRRAPTSLADPGDALDSPPSPTRRAQSVGEQALAASVYDSWQVRLSKLSLEVVDPCPALAPGDGASDSRRVTPVILPVSLGVRVQMSFLSRAQQPEALRVQASIERIAVVSSLALAQRAIHLHRKALALFVDLGAVSAYLQSEFEAVNAQVTEVSTSGAAVWGRPAENDAVAAPSPAPSTSVAPPSAIVLDLHFGELSLLVHDVRRVVRAAIERRAASGVQEPFRTTAAAVLALPSATTEPSSSEFTVSLSRLAATSELASSGVTAALSLGAFTVIDYFQRSGDAFARFVDSVNADTPGAPLFFLKARYAVPVGTGGPNVRLQLDAGSLHVSYNPETVAALQWYNRFLVECIALAAPEAGHSRSSPVHAPPPPLPTHAADVPDSVPQLSDLLALVAPPDGTSEGLRTIDAAPPESLTVAASAHFGSLEVVLQKETEQRKIARVVVAGLVVAVNYASDKRGGMLAEVELKEVAVFVPKNDGAEAALFRAPGSAVAGLLEGASSAIAGAEALPIISPRGAGWLRRGCALRLRFQQWSCTTAGLDVSVQLGIAPLGSELHLQPALELFDYAQRGLVKSLLAAAGATTGSSLAQAQQSDSLIRLELAVQSARIDIPGTVVGDAVFLDLGSLVVAGEPVQDRSMNELTVCGGALVMGAASANAPAQVLLRSSSDTHVKLRLPLGTARPGMLTMDASVDLPGLSASLTDAQILLALRIVLGHLRNAVADPQLTAPRLPPNPSEPAPSTALESTSWLGISCGGSESQSLTVASRQPSPMRVQIDLRDGVSLALRPLQIASAVMVSLGHASITVDVDKSFAGSVDLRVALDRLAVVEERHEAAGLVRADMICPIAASAHVDAASSAPASEDSIFGTSDISSEIRNAAELSKHLCARVVYDPRDCSTLVELAVMHTVINPSPTGLTALLALTRSLSALTPPTSGSSTLPGGDSTAMALINAPVGVAVPDFNDAPLAGAVDVARVRADVAHPKSRIDVRALIVGVAVVLPVKQFSQSPAVVINMGAEAWACLELTSPTTPLRLSLKAGADLLVFTHPAVIVNVMPSLDQRCSVLDRLAVFADAEVVDNVPSIDAPPGLCSVSIRASCVQLYIRPSLLRTALGIVGAFEAVKLFSNEDTSAEVLGASVAAGESHLATAAESSRREGASSSAINAGKVRPFTVRYTLSWMGLVALIDRGREDSDAMLGRATVDPVEVAVNSSDGAHYSASASLSLQAHLWSSEAQRWDAMTLQPWGFDASIRARLSHDEQPRCDEPFVQVDLFASSKLLVRLTDVRLQEMLSGANEWLHLVSVLTAARTLGTAAPSSPTVKTAAQSTPVPPPGSRALQDELLASRKNVLRLAINLPILSAELVTSDGTGEAAPVVKLVIMGLRVGFLSADFEGISGSAVSCSVAGLHILDFVEDSSASGLPLLLTSCLEKDAQRAICDTFCVRGVGAAMRSAADDHVHSTPIVNVAFVNLSAPCPPALRQLASDDASEDAFETTCARFELDAIHANLRASSLRRVLTFLASAFRAPSADPDVTVDNPMAVAPSTVLSAALFPPSPAIETKVHFSARLVSIGLYSDSLARQLGTVEVADAAVDARIFRASHVAAENGSLAISGVFGALRVVDAHFADRAHPFSHILTPGPLELLDSSTPTPSPLMTFSFRSFGAGADVRASTSVSAGLSPLRVVYIAKHVGAIIDVVSVEIARIARAPTSSAVPQGLHGPAFSSSPISSLDGSVETAPRVPPAAMMDLNVTLHGLVCVIPVLPELRASASVRISKVVVRNSEPVFCRLTRPSSCTWLPVLFPILVSTCDHARFRSTSLT